MLQRKLAEYACVVPIAVLAAITLAPAKAEPGDVRLIERFLQSEGVAPSPTAQEIPLVACRTTGQVDKDAPRLPPTTTMPLYGEGGDRLAFYSAAELGNSGVLAPRGWACIHVVGSSGESLVVAPQEAMSEQQLASKTWAGPAVIRSLALGDTSGRFAVAGLSARLFPKARGFVDRVRAERGSNAADWTAPSWPDDRLDYLSDTVVAYRTSGAEGLGYFSGMSAGSLPVRGITGLLGSIDQPSLLHLAVRLSEQDAALYPTIAAQVLASSWFAEGASDVLASPPRPAAAASAAKPAVPAPAASAVKPALPGATASSAKPVPAETASTETPEVPAATASTAKTAVPAERVSALATVTGFYGALARGDGFAAQQYLVPEKRGRGNYEPIAMSRFYGGLVEPLKLLSADQSGPGEVRVAYRFRSRGGVCNGTASVALRRNESAFLIQSIDVDHGC